MRLIPKLMRRSSITTVDEEDDFAARILVVGDTSVGKTTLLQALCDGKPGVATSYPIMVHVKVLSSGQCIEFRDVGGHPAYKEARSMFYSVPYDGVMLVYDLCNPRSLRGLPGWLNELSAHGLKIGAAYQSNGASSGHKYDLEMEEGANTTIPLLLVGNKSDVVCTQSTHKEVLPDYEGLAVQASAFNLDDSVFTAFFERAIRHRASVQERVVPQSRNYEGSWGQQVPVHSYSAFTGEGSGRVRRVSNDGNILASDVSYGRDAGGKSKKLS